MQLQRLFIHCSGCFFFCFFFSGFYSVRYDIFMKEIGVNPIALRKAKIAYNFGLSECNRVKKSQNIYHFQHFFFPNVLKPNPVKFNIKITSQ